MTKKALTLIELLLTLGIIVVVLAASIPFYFSFYVGSETSNNLNEMTTAIQRAKMKALSEEDDDSWSVNIGNDNQITIFRGNNYQNRNSNYDETSDLSQGLTITGQTTITFFKGSGLPVNTGTIQIHDSNNNNFQLTIDAYGNTATNQI